MTVAALVLSGIAVVVAIASARYARQAANANARVAEVEEARRRDEIADRDARLAESRRAVLRAAIESLGNRTYLLIRNVGPATARAVIARIPEGVDGVRLLNEDPATIHPDGHRRVILSIALGDRPAFPVLLSWEDDDGRHEETLEIRLPGH